MSNPAIDAFIKHVVAIAEKDKGILAVAAAGSAITQETDEFSDLDLVIVTENAIAPDAGKMRGFAARFPGLIAAFTGDHVGERRLLICLYENPLLHVDFKFLLPQEVKNRVEDPLVLFEREGVLTRAFASAEPKWPMPELQWIEDRFWVWVHYGATKIGRGEFFEVVDFLSFLRSQVLGPMLALRYAKLPRGVRKLEQFLNEQDLAALRATHAPPERFALVAAVKNTVAIYLRERENYQTTMSFNKRAEIAALAYLHAIEVDNDK